MDTRSRPTLTRYRCPSNLFYLGLNLIVDAYQENHAFTLMNRFIGIRSHENSFLTFPLSTRIFFTIGYRLYERDTGVVAHTMASSKFQSCILSNEELASFAFA